MKRTHILAKAAEIHPADAKLAPIEPRKEPQQARSRARFEKILEGTVDLITPRGVDAVAMSEIAEKAEISIASLYQYFPDKASIIATLAERYNALGQACVEECFADAATKADLISGLHMMVDSYFGYFQEVPGGLAIWQAIQSDSRLQELDAADMENHAQTIAAAFARADPEMPRTRAKRLGRLFASIVATSVRDSTSLTKREALATLEELKVQVLTPAVNAALG